MSDRLRAGMTVRRPASYPGNWDLAKVERVDDEDNAFIYYEDEMGVKRRRKVKAADFRAVPD